MAYRVKSRYYADSDQFGESFVLTSDNAELDRKFEIGEKVVIFTKSDWELFKKGLNNGKK